VTTFADNETPDGTLNGSNAAFVLTFAPSPAGSLKIYKNGILLRASIDYSVSGTTINFVNASIPRSADSLVAFYRH
jgi:hypothetical protein